MKDVTGWEVKDVTGMEIAERLLWLHEKYGSLPFFEVLESLERQKDYSKFLSDEVRRLYSVLESIAKNTCCDKCREAALVAEGALTGKGRD